MKIVSLLPSATEIVYALGLGDQLVGVTDECDFPAEATTKPVVSRSALRQGRPLSSREIDDAVRGQIAEGDPLYMLDTDLLRRESPDVILTQDLCRVCAVPTGEVQQALDQIGLPDAKVISLDPNTLEEVIAQLEVVGTLLGAPERGAEIASQLRDRITTVKATAARLPTVSAFALEWADPPFAAGHWVPEMIELVAGVPVLSEKGTPSREIGWHEVREAAPEVIVFMPCGYYLEEAEEEGAGIVELADVVDTPAARNGNVFAVEATSFFSRPGPRIVDGVEILGWAIHPEAYPTPPDSAITKL